MQKTMPIICAEIYDYLNILGKDYIKSIPEDLYKKIEKNRDLNYASNYDKNRGLTKDTYSEDTINFILMLDLKYWSTELEKRQKLKRYNQNEENYQKELRKKYNPNSIFESNNTNSVLMTSKNELGLIIYKESILKKILNKIKIAFNKEI